MGWDRFLAAFFFGASAFAGPPSETLAFDERALVALSQVGTVEQMSEYLRKEFGLAVIALPEHPEAEEAGTPSRLYNNLKGRTLGYFLGAYLPFSADQQEEEALLPYFKRPYGEQDLIAYREGISRGVLLHEAAHYLIEKRRRETAGLTPKENARVRLKQVIGMGDAPGEFAQAQRVAQNAIDALHEEMRINHYLLSHRKELNLDLADTQFLLGAIRGNIPHYLAIESSPYLSRLKEAERKEVEGLLAAARKTFQEGNRAFLDENKPLKAFGHSNEQGICHPPPYLSSQNLQSEAKHSAKEGIQSGGIRGTVLSLCTKVLALLAKYPH